VEGYGPLVCPLWFRDLGSLRDHKTHRSEKIRSHRYLQGITVFEGVDVYKNYNAALDLPLKREDNQNYSRDERLDIIDYMDDSTFTFHC